MVEVRKRTGLGIRIKIAKVCPNPKDIGAGLTYFNQL